MTIGIYKLVFEGTDKVYIGQSINIQKRYKEHLNSFKTGIISKKLLQGFIDFGTPILEIVCICTIEKLNELEDYYILLYNTVGNNGFNTLNSSEDIPCLYGESNGSSKYSNKQIELVFNILVDTPEKTAKEIEQLTGVSTSVIYSIANLNNHLWLENKFPQQYKILKNLKGTRYSSAKGMGIVYPSIKSPTGIIFNIDSLRKFAREHNLTSSHLSEVLNKKAKSHKGWVLA